MIKSLFTSKISATASPECVVIGLKLVDSETHAMRLFGLVLLAVSLAILVCEWRKKASDQAVAVAPVATSKQSRKHSRRSASSR
jgi:hypothetical protein